MLALSFTRDATLVLVLATGWVWVRARTWAAVRVLLIGIAASIPAPALFRVPLAKQMAWALAYFHIPSDTSWGYVLPHTPKALAHVAYNDFLDPSTLSIPVLAYVVGAAILAAVVYMLFATPRRDPYDVLLEQRSSAVL